MSTYSVDRIEGEIVVLEDENRSRHNVPLCRFDGLPQEGDIVTEQEGRYQKDEAATKQRRAFLKKMSQAVFEQRGKGK